MEKIDENIRVEHYSLYKIFGITEWKQKKNILEPKEILDVLKLLRTKEDSELLAIVKLPFPEFIRTYYMTYYKEQLMNQDKIVSLDQRLNFDTFMNDLSIGYRFYIMGERLAKLLDRYIKMPNVDINGTKRDVNSFNNLAYLHMPRIIDFLTFPLDQLHRISSPSHNQSYIVKNYIYIMQYVDAKEAKRLNLSSYTFLNQGCYRGFELDKKLSLFNDLERALLIRYLGLNGYCEYKAEELGETLGICGKNYQLEQLFCKDFLSLFTGTLGELKNAIGYIEESKYVAGRHIYNSRKKYFKVANSLEKNVILSNMSTEEHAEFKRVYAMYYNSSDRPLTERLYQIEISRVLSDKDMDKEKILTIGEK